MVLIVVYSSIFISEYSEVVERLSVIASQYVIPLNLNTEGTNLFSVF